LLSAEVTPVMHAELSFNEVRETHRMMEAGENFGKIVMSLQ